MLTREKLEIILGEFGKLAWERESAYEDGILEGISRVLEITTGISAPHVYRAVLGALLDGTEDVHTAGQIIAHELERKGFSLPLYSA